MKLNSTSLLFMNTMMIGIMVSTCSNNWMMIWTGLEISTMSFMPLISSKNMLSSESSMKYFVTQSMSSSILVMGMLTMLIKSMLNESVLLYTDMMVKIGMAPFHNCILSMIEGLEYPMIFTLLTIMKLAPLVMVSYMSSNLSMIIMITLMISSISSLNQNSIRKILGYYSIFNSAFMMSSINQNSIWLSYMMMYMTMMALILMMMKKMKINYINQLIINSMKNKSSLNMWMTMMSLGGMPPFMGFTAKLMVIELMMSQKEMTMTAIMIFSSLITMFFFTRMSFVSMMSNSTMMKWNMNWTSSNSMVIMMINMLCLPTMITFKCLN